MINWLSYIDREPATFEVESLTPEQALEIALMFDLDHVSEFVIENQACLSWKVRLAAETDHPRFNDFVESFGPIKEQSDPPLIIDKTKSAKAQLSAYIASGKRGTVFA